MKHDSIPKHDRRQFILKAFSSCAFCCLAAPGVFASSKNLSSDKDHKFLLDSEMTLQEVYDFSYKHWYIPAMKNLMEQIGKDKFIELLTKSSDMLYERNKESEINYNERTLLVWSNNIKEASKKMEDRLTYEIIKDDEEVFEIKFTECLWAKTFREANASEIGYAGVCCQDYGMTKKFNPKLKLDRKTTLMQGNDSCHFKWYMSKQESNKITVVLTSYPSGTIEIISESDSLLVFKSNRPYKDYFKNGQMLGVALDEFERYLWGHVVIMADKLSIDYKYEINEDEVISTLSYKE